MQADIILLTVTAAMLGLFHTVIGPDHYLPFIVIGRARKWSLPKTAGITALCGVGHVLSSVVIGFIGIALGLAIASVEGVEGVRGEIAAWALIAFGFTYMAWGLHRAHRGKRHTHAHHHLGSHEHTHEHSHADEHAHPHVHGKPAPWKSLTPWVLFTIFVLGPCEPLIPLLMYPAATGSMWGVALVALVFSAVTIATMVGITVIVSFQLHTLRTERLEKFSHALAGAAIGFSGLAIILLGI